MRAALQRLKAKETKMKLNPQRCVTGQERSWIGKGPSRRLRVWSRKCSTTGA